MQYDLKKKELAISGLESILKNKKLNIQKTKIMASCPITSWQIDGGKVETVTDFYFSGSKVIADVDWSHETKDACSLEVKLWLT